MGKNFENTVEGTEQAEHVSALRHWLVDSLRALVVAVVVVVGLSFVAEEEPESHDGRRPPVPDVIAEHADQVAG